MKKIIVMLISIILLTGCGKVDKDKVINNFINKVEDSESYTIKGRLEIYNSEDIFNYDINVYYKKNDLFNVDMLNTNNDHRQIILRDSEAVYVVTPSLNKSYKFSSEWPYNSSQSYILNSIVRDIKDDDEIIFNTIDDKYVLEVDVNYPNNSYLKYEKIIFDNDLNLLNVIVYDQEDIESVKVTFDDIDYNAKLDDSYFDINHILEDNCCNVQDKETSNILDVIYPMYVPQDTYLESKEVVNTENGERVILTFSGSRNFVLIEESSNVYNEFETIPVYGDLLMMNNTIGALSNNSLSWSSNNMDYYLASNDLSSEEVKAIAESLNTSVFLEK